MSNSSSNISIAVIQLLPGNSSSQEGGSSISIKINGASYLFDPSKSQALVAIPQASISSQRPGLVVQTFFQLRQENSSIGNSEGTTNYFVELFESKNLDSDGEFRETLEQELEEREDPELEERESFEDTTFSEDKPSMQDGDFSEENESEDVFCKIALEELATDQRAKKMWKRARKSILESLQQKKGKIHSSLSTPFDSVFSFSLMFKKLSD